MEKEIIKIQADALQMLGRELSAQELQSFLELKIMEAAFEIMDFETLEVEESATSKLKN